MYVYVCVFTGVLRIMAEHVNEADLKEFKVVFFYFVFVLVFGLVVVVVAAVVVVVAAVVVVVAVVVGFLFLLSF